jgi:hypothetical protein
LAVSAPAATDVWAAGGDFRPRDNTYHTLVEDVCPV